MRTKTTTMIVVGLVFLAAGTNLWAATITVTSDSGWTGGPDCKVRDAITAANTDTATGGCPAGSGADVIELPAGVTITLTVVDNSTNGSNGLPSLSSEMTINGNGATIERSSAGGTPDFRIFRISGSNVLLNNLTVTGGDASGSSNGGGIFIGGGTLTLTETTITNNSAYMGGGIYNVAGLVEVTYSTISENTSFDNGGGIYNNDRMTLIQSTVNENLTLIRHGGGIYTTWTFSLINSTVSGNAHFKGESGGIYNGPFSTLEVTNSTVSDNLDGGIINAGELTLTNSILANNSGWYGDCQLAGGYDPTINDNGFNIVENGSSCGFPAAGDPNLGPLADNGGPTQTHALLCGSIAIDAINDPAACTIDTDQRGVPRPQGPFCDIGSFETTESEACTDTDGDGVPDVDDNCNLFNPDQADCQDNGVGDVCDIADGTSSDTDDDGVPDECDNCSLFNPDQADCQDNGVGDVCDIADGTSSDCNDNDTPDECDIAQGSSADCNGNGVPDECDSDTDADNDGVQDICDNCNLFNPDQADCQDNGVGDVCDIADGTSSDCNDNDTPDECDIAQGSSADCNGNGIPDECITLENDCNLNGLVDECEQIITEQVISTAADGVASVFAADLDGDGDNDVLSSSIFDDTIAWYENTDGAGAFGGQQVISTAANWARSVFAADLDGDGDIDVLSASQDDDKIAWYENSDGAGTFGGQQVISTAADGPVDVFAADLDGDGDIDVLSASYVDDKIAWYENTDGAGTFGGQQVISTAANGATSVFAADLDGDGDIDVLSASRFDDKIAWYENTDGLGSFGPQQIISVAADFAQSVFAADLDGDGDLDVLSASRSDDKIAWYENTDGLGSFGPQQVISTAADGARSVFAADLDGDGDTDVLSASIIDDKIAWYENLDGLGTFGEPQVISNAANGAISVFAADLDGDGDTDVLSASLYDDKIAWYRLPESTDCNGNDIPDECDIAEGNNDDCNGNDIPDECDIADGTSHDDDQDGIPDECRCPADFDGDGTVNAADLAQLLGAWGPYEPCPPFDAADFNEDCGVNAADLAQLLGSWGPCE